MSNIQVVNKTIDRSPVGSTPIVEALDLLKQKLILTGPNTTADLALLGLSVKTDNQNDPLALINDILRLQEGNNTILTQQQLDEYLTFFMQTGATATTTGGKPLCEAIRNKVATVPQNNTPQTHEKLQDGLEIAVILLATQAVGQLYAHLLEQSFPNRKTTGFDQQEASTVLQNQNISSPQALQTALQKNKIAVPNSVQTLITQLITANNPLLQDFVTNEYPKIIETTKSSYEEFCRVTGSQSTGQTGSKDEVDAPFSNEQPTTSQQADLPPREREQPSPQKAQATTGSSSYSYTSSVSAQNTPVTKTATATPTKQGSSRSGEGLAEIGVGLGLIFGTLYFSNKKKGAAGESPSPSTKNFWGNIGKGALIAGAVAAGGYGVYKGYQYLTNKTGKSAEQNAANSTAGGTTGEGTLYPIPPEDIVGGSTSTKTSESQDDSANNAANDTTSPPVNTEDEDKDDSSTEQKDDNKNNNTTNTTETDNSTSDVERIVPPDVPSPDKATTLSDAQKKALAEANKDAIDALSKKKTSLDGTKAIADELSDPVKTRVLKMYNTIKTKTLKDKSQIEKKRTKGDGICIIDSKQKPYVMYLIDDDKIKATFPISPGEKGFGNKPWSYKTPTGIMYLGASIKGTNDTDVLGEGSIKDKNDQEYHKKGSPYRPGDREHSQITARKIAVYGLENENYNASSRSIFCHGTNNPQELGYATSQGCIRLSNADAIQLAEYIKNKKNSQKKVFLGVIE